MTINCSTAIPIDASIIKQNRFSLSKVSCWISDYDYIRSFYNYGLPETVRHLIDRPINSQITYTDILCQLSNSLIHPVNYLELGVSVGKNLYQLMNYLENSFITGIDIEDINPQLEAMLQDKQALETWDTVDGSMRTTISSRCSYKYRSNVITYLAGDVFDECSWMRLSNNDFNLVFSDAFHSRSAIAFEYEMIEKYGLLNKDKFAIVWDDLGNNMTQEFGKIFKKMKERFQLTDSDMRLIKCGGWLGNHEHQHLVGIISKFR